MKQDDAGSGLGNRILLLYLCTNTKYESGGGISHSDALHLFYYLPTYCSTPPCCWCTLTYLLKHALIRHISNGHITLLSQLFSHRSQKRGSFVRIHYLYSNWILRWIHISCITMYPNTLQWQSDITTKIISSQIDDVLGPRIMYKWLKWIGDWKWIRKIYKNILQFNLERLGGWNAGKMM